MTFSIIIPVYNSHTTIERCLNGVEKLRHESFEVILVDSSPDDRSAEIIRRFPRFRLIRSEHRLLYHEAKNRAIPHAAGETLVFLDPDCIPAPDWLLRLEEGLRGGHSVVGGGLACAPGGLTSTAAHLVKFWQWLPGEETRILDDLPSANLAVRRQALDAVGLFDGSIVAGDTEMCNRLRRNGFPSYFDGRAVVEHIHEATVSSLVRERFMRGIDFAVMRASQPGWHAALSVLAVAGWPLLALRQWYWQGKAAAGHGLLGGFAVTTPVILLADAAWMIGGAIGHLRSLLRWRRRV